MTQVQLKKQCSFVSSIGTKAALLSYGGVSHKVHPVGRSLEVRLALR